jgi:ferrochelatase
MATSQSLPPDAVLVVSFGGPERREDVLPFLDHVLRGRHVPESRKLEVAEHYYRFGGSPINAQNRELAAKVSAELASRGRPFRVYLGNRNWHPILADTLRKMAADGVRRALAFVTSAFSSYSGCRQYLEDIAAARGAVGETAPTVEKLRPFFNHPAFVAAVALQAQTALAEIPAQRRDAAEIVFTAHSIPSAAAANCRYEEQLREAAGLVAAAIGRAEYALAYQSRSGPLWQPWLGPDIGEWLAQAAGKGLHDVVVVPIGFVSDHIEVVYDLDTQARAQAEQMGLTMVRAGTVGTHPAFVGMICDLVAERADGLRERASLGRLGACPDVCPDDCCPPPGR